MKNQQPNKQDIVRKFLCSIGENPNRKGLGDTPNRVAKMWEEMYVGYDESKKPKITVFPNNDDGIKYDQIITDTGTFFSQCEHHTVPFFGTYYFGYIPNKHIVGLSKVARLVQWFSSKLQVQERLTEEIATDFDKLLKPKGVILVLKGRHLCKEMRGVKMVNGQMTTSVVKGTFKTDISAREEFFRLVNLKTGDN